MANGARDWPLPSDPSKWLSAWPAFHDATLTHIAMDVANHTLTATLDLGYPTMGSEPNPRVTMEFGFPSHVLIYTYIDEGAPRLAIPVGTPRRERARMLREHRRQSFVGTLAVAALADVLADDPMEVIEADYRTAKGKTELRLDGYSNGPIGSWLQLDIRAESLRITSEPGGEVSIESLLEMGARAWDAWRNR